MKKIFTISAVLAVVLIFLIFLYKKQEQIAVSPSVEYILDEAKIKSLQGEALSGSCEAAIRLAKYKLNIALNAREAIHWFRVAGPCLDVNAKLELLGLLMADEQPDNVGEVNALILDIEKLDTLTAKRVQESIYASRIRHK